MYKCKILSFKMYGTKYMLKYKIQINFCAKFKCITRGPRSYCVLYHYPEIREISV